MDILRRELIYIWYYFSVMCRLKPLENSSGKMRALAF